MLQINTMLGLRPLAPTAPAGAPRAAQAPIPATAAPAISPDTLRLLTRAGKLPATIDFGASFIKRNGGQFTLDGKPFRFVGCNMYSLTWEKSETTDKMLADAAAEGFTVVRFWANKTTPAKMQEIFDSARKHGIKLIPVLANNGSFSEEMKANDSWYRGGYKKDYLPYVENMVGTFKGRPEVMMWELVNEPETAAFEPLLAFSEHVSQRIKQLDPNHLVSIGTIGGLGDKFGSQLSRFDNDKYRKLYELPTLDALSIHDYSYDANGLERMDILMRNQGNKEWSKRFGTLDKYANYLSRKLDDFVLDHFDTRLYQPLSVRGRWMANNEENLRIAKDLNKPLYVGEAGYKKFHGDDRKTHFSLDMQNYFAKGAQGYMMWSFQAQGRSIDGHDYGFDSKDGFAPLIKGWNNKFLSELK